MPSWEPDTWTEQEKGFTRFLRADQALNWVASIHPLRDDRDRFITAVRHALHSWRVPVEEHLVGRNYVLERRIEAVRVDLRVRFRFASPPDLFPEEMRGPIQGLTSRMTEQSDGLLRYLSAGWDIDDFGRLRFGSTADNLAGYRRWLEGGAVPELPSPDSDGIFHLGEAECLLPFLWVYVPGSRPFWQADTWHPVAGGFARLMPADRLLAWIASFSSSETERGRFVTAARDAIWTSLVPREWLPGRRGVFLSAVKLICCRPDVRLRWSRRPDLFPNALRHAYDGVDPVHTPENARAGLTRYLGAGWEVDDEGALRHAGPKGCCWGPSTVLIPHRIHDAPRRLMLAASLQARAVELEQPEPPPEGYGGKPWQPPGVTLRALFSAFGGWTHEDAIVLSRSAATKLARKEPYKIEVLVPAQAADEAVIQVEVPGVVRRGTKLARARMDLYAFGFRRHEAEREGAHEGWLEIRLPDAVAPFDGELIAVERTQVRTRNWRELLTFQFALGDAAVGTKLSTRHGVKGVVSRIVEDAAMPLVGAEPAEIILSPVGILRRGAIGQFAEACGSTPARLPRSGTIHVMRQPQEAAVDCRVRGSRQGAARGQRYGEMEFRVLMAHGAVTLARELLSEARSTAVWIEQERQLGPKGHRQLATAALNRYLAILGTKIEDGALVTPKVADGTITVRPEPAIRRMKVESLTERRDARDYLQDSALFVKEGGICAINFKQPVTVCLWSGNRKLKVIFEGMYVLPPWLRPAAKSKAGWYRPHELTQAYESLIFALPQRWTSEGWGKIQRSVEACVRAAFSDSVGAGAFLRCHVLGRRLNRSARAVIVPRPDLQIDRIAIPEFIAEELFAGLPDACRTIVLVNRNPTLHRTGLLAMRPVIERSRAPVFGLPLGVLSAFGADFDGDEATVVALAEPSALAEAQRLLPGACRDLRLDPFRRGGTPAFPLLNELRIPSEETALALMDETALSQAAWCEKHLDLVRARLEAIGDGWNLFDPDSGLEVDEELIRKWEGHKQYLEPLDEANWHDLAREEMKKVYATVRAKGRLGGVLRREFYRLAYQDHASFWVSVAALQAVTARMVQSALSVKTGKGVTAFNPAKFFQDALETTFGAHRARARSLAVLDKRLSYATVWRAFGARSDPQGLLRWLARPTLKTLVDLICTAEKPVSFQNDPRVSWFLG